MTRDSQEKGPEKFPPGERIHRKAFDRAAEFFEKKLERKGKYINRERVQSILYAFLKEELNATRTFTSAAYGVSFIYSVVDTAAVAKLLYREYGGTLPPLEVPASGTEEGGREFIFGSYVSSRMNGFLFPFFDKVGLQAVIRDLPHALSDIAAGREPRRHEVCFVGSPTRDIGHITPQFVEVMKKKGPYEAFADVYADFVTLVNRERGSADIRLRGISMGASFALKTAEKLLAAQQASQSRNKADIAGVPFMEVRLDAPVSQTSFGRWRRKRQVHIGYAVHFVWSMLTSSYSRSTSNPFSAFMRDVSPILKEKGIAEDMSREQRHLKKEATTLLMDALYGGVPVPENVHTIEVIGFLDILTLSPGVRLGDFVKDLAGKLEKPSPNEKPLSEAVPLSRKKNRDTYGIWSGHEFPNFPPSTVADMYRADQALAKVTGKG